MNIPLDATHLHLIVLPTEKCNFRCSYCYENFAIGRMSPGVVMGIKSLISARSLDLKSLRLCWFGGEPLAAHDIVLDIARFALDRCEAQGLRLLTGEVTTNGYLLTTGLAQRLVEQNQSSFQISLDGLETEHDATRRLASGAGTFRRIWSNLKALTESSIEFRILLRLHLHRNNFQSMSRLARLLRVSLLRDSRFTAFVRPISDFGGPAAGHISTHFLAPRERLTSELSGLNDILRNSSAAPTTPAPAQDVAQICYAASPNSFVIRADGRVAKCTVALSDDRNTIGTLAEDGRLMITASKLAPWVAGFVSGAPSALKCPWSHLPAPRN